MMPQTWDPVAYGKDGAFVHELAGGVLEWLAPQPGERILDLGCGDGQLTQRIAENGCHCDCDRCFRGDGRRRAGTGRRRRKGAR